MRLLENFYRVFLPKYHPPWRTFSRLIRVGVFSMILELTQKHLFSSFSFFFLFLLIFPFLLFFLLFLFLFLSYFYIFFVKRARNWFVSGNCEFIRGWGYLRCSSLKLEFWLTSGGGWSDRFKMYHINLWRFGRYVIIFSKFDYTLAFWKQMARMSEPRRIFLGEYSPNKVAWSANTK